MNILEFETENLKQYTNSLLFDSGTEIACLKVEDKGRTVVVSLNVCGEVHIVYKENVYKRPSEFPKEVIELIKNGDPDEELYIGFNNWFEYIYGDEDYTDGIVCEDDVSRFTPTILQAKMFEIAKWYLKK